MPVSDETYKTVALEDPEGQWELVCGRLRSKPIMTTEHNAAMNALSHQLDPRLDWNTYVIRTNSGRLRTSNGWYFIPDLCVVPKDLEKRLRQRPGTFEVYDEPMPLVVQIWSPSTGDYDVNEKLRKYQRRGDLEIWRIHPYERTLTAWCRRPDGTYDETVYRGGVASATALPGMSVDVDRLFD